MDFNAIIALITDSLSRADWAAFTNWDSVSRVLDSVIPEAAQNYQP